MSLLHPLLAALHGRWSMLLVGMATAIAVGGAYMAGRTANAERVRHITTGRLVVVQLVVATAGTVAGMLGVRAPVWLGLCAVVVALSAIAAASAWRFGPEARRPGDS